MAGWLGRSLAWGVTLVLRVGMIQLELVCACVFCLPPRETAGLAGLAGDRSLARLGRDARFNARWLNGRDNRAELIKLKLELTERSSDACLCVRACSACRRAKLQAHV